MATTEEKLAALGDALAAMTPEERKDEAKQFLAMWEAMLPFLPKPAASPSIATLLVQAVPTTDEQKQDVAEVYQKSKDLALELLQSEAGSSP